MPTPLRTRSLLSLACLAALAFGAAPRALATSLAPLRAAPSASSALARALETISADEIRSDIFFIASDEMGGRDTPSVGQRIAARFLRARLERYGFEPGAPGGFLFHYAAGRKRIDDAGSQLRIGSGDSAQKLAYGQDWFLFSTQDLIEREVAGSAVWCGEGRPEDFERAAPKGKWALCLDTKESPFRRRREAQKAGALGLLVLERDLEERQPYAQRFAEVTRNLREGVVTGPGAVENPDIVPSVYLAKAPAEALLARLQAGQPQGALPPVGLALELELALAAKLADPGGQMQLEDVCGFWPGSDPVLKNEVLILSAHYDHVGTRNGEVYNGADDNGSGTCTLLAVAEALKDYGPMRRSVMLIWVSGEEKGLWGSSAFAKNPYFPREARPVADINIDMVGRNAPDKLLITPTEKHKAFNGITQLARELGPLEGFPELGSADSYYSRSDHIEFAKLGIPIAFLFSDLHEDYHKPGDDPEKIDCDKVQRVARLVMRMLDGLQGDELKLERTPPATQPASQPAPPPEAR